MNMGDIVVLLRSLNVKGVPGPLGVAFEWYFDHGNVPRTGRAKFRIESGSGIAGRSDAWNVCELPTGEPLGPKVKDKAALRSQILAAIAEGNRPPDREGYETYARWHTVGLTSSVQWFQRRNRRRWPENKNERHLERACLCEETPCPCHCHSPDAPHG